MEEEEEEFKVVSLHHNPCLYDTCADLLNSEWMRSKTARLHSLHKSCDQLPISLVMVAHHPKLDSAQPYVIGHSMLSRCVGIEKACFIESVLLDKEYRGRGLGRKIMIASEEFAVCLGFQTIYLSTHDKQGFYEHLGYKYCDPISKADSCTKRLPAGFLKQLCRRATTSAGNTEASPNSRQTFAEKKVECTTVSSDAMMTPISTTYSTTTTIKNTNSNTKSYNNINDNNMMTPISTTYSTTTTTKNTNSNNKSYNNMMTPISTTYSTTTTIKNTNSNTKSSNADTATVTDKHVTGQSPTTIPPPPMPPSTTPPLPPPPPPLIKSSNRPEIVRMDINLISWMKKELC